MKPEKALSHIPRIPRSMILEYEIHSTWWAGWLFTGWMHTLAGRYFARKVKRKYARYEASIKQRESVIRYQPPAPPTKNEDRRQNVPAAVRPAGEVSDQAPDGTQDTKA